MSSQTIFITGASSGFGAACARFFASNGNRLVLTARRIDPLLALKAELEGKAEIHIVPLDVRDREAVQGAVASLPERFREIDVLLNNAGQLIAPGSMLDAQLNNTLQQVGGAAQALRILADYLERHPEALIQGKSGNAK